MIERYILADTLLVLAAFLLSYRRQALRHHQHDREIEGRHELVRIPLILALDALSLAILVEIYPRYWWLGFIVWFVTNAFFLVLLRTRSQPRGRGTT
jgi:hypothetical protein